MDKRLLVPFPPFRLLTLIGADIHIIIAYAQQMGIWPPFGGLAALPI